MNNPALNKPKTVKLLVKSKQISMKKFALKLVMIAFILGHSFNPHCRQQDKNREKSVNNL